MPLSESTWAEIIEMELVKIQALETQTKIIVESVFANGINIDTLDFATERIAAEVDLLNLPSAYRQLMKGILKAVELKPNLVYNPIATEERRREVGIGRRG